MNKLKGFGVAMVFLVGCAVGGASGRFIVPPANAQQVAVTKWEYTCTPTPSREIPEFVTSKFGAKGWEVFYVSPPGIAGLWCFKRQKQ